MDNKRFPIIAWVALGAAAAMVVGAFGPWIKAPFGISVSGTDGANDGWVIVGSAALGALGALGFGRLGQRAYCVITLAGGIAGAATGWYDRGEVRDRIEAADFGSIGWGLNLSLVASAVLAMVGLFGLLGVRWDTHRQLGPPPPAG